MLRKGLGSKVMPDFSFARTSSLYLEESVVVKSCRAFPGDLNLTSMLTATRHHDFLDSAFLPRLCCSCYRPIKAGRADSEASRKLSVPHGHHGDSDYDCDWRSRNPAHTLLSY